MRNRIATASLAVLAFSVIPADGQLHSQGALGVTFRQFEYTVTNLGLLEGPGGLSVANAVNGLGVAAGTGVADANYRAAIFDHGQTLELPPVSGDESQGFGLNDFGQVVGQTDVDSGFSHGFIWLPAPAYGLPAGMAALGTFGGPYSKASDINNVGQVVGGASGFDAQGSTWRAFRWQYGAMTDLGTPGGRNAEALAINDVGMIVGHANASPADANYRACVWRPGYAPLDLGTLGGNASRASAVNNTGVVVGESENGELTGHSGTLRVRRAFLWNGGAMIALGTLPIGPLPGGPYGPDNIHSAATGINSAGVVVGHSFPSLQSAWICRDGVMQNLNSLIPPDSGWVLRYAYGINDAGQIVGAGRLQGEIRAFLLTPTTPRPWHGVR